MTKYTNNSHNTMAKNTNNGHNTMAKNTMMEINLSFLNITFPSLLLLKLWQKNMILCFLENVLF